MKAASRYIDLRPLSFTWSPASRLFHLSRLLLATVAMLLVSATTRPAAAGEPPPAGPPPAGSIQDETGLLGHGPGTAALRDRVARASARAGLPIAIAIVSGTTSSHDDSGRLEEVARLRFTEAGFEAGFNEGGGDAVLLLVAPRAGRAVLETGKGEAGIVPEIDARRITADVVRAIGRHASAATLAPALAEAAERIADSALATRERRRPLPDQHASERDELPAPSPPRDRPTSATVPAPPPHRSLMPGAYALAALVVVGLALRQRRRSASDRRTEITRR